MPAQFTSTNRPILMIFMKFLIHSLGCILGYTKALYTVRPEQSYYIQYLLIKSEPSKLKIHTYTHKHSHTPPVGCRPNFISARYLGSRLSSVHSLVMTRAPTPSREENVLKHVKLK